ncbi:hypothetical protein LOTGIDRAFT_171801 [Lottia gigantea]|uniref:Uncharacterized protein n=1 Tax=Lottia gigantea TaxID=225164 RepID=V4B5C2_LOTGI|nr:hypothetical protein LOTGIDRAFT_171801 [Lottia gigantea]ESP02726.1 hypothetical protein LOTGIDRAFT_171801 [Lottia gigantea]
MTFVSFIYLICCIIFCVHSAKLTHRLQQKLNREISKYGVDVSFFQTRIGEAYLRTQGLVCIPNFSEIRETVYPTDTSLKSEYILWVLQHYENRFPVDISVAKCSPGFSPIHINKPVLLNITSHPMKFCFQKIAVSCHRTVTAMERMDKRRLTE